MSAFPLAGMGVVSGLAASDGPLLGFLSRGGRFHLQLVLGKLLAVQPDAFGDGSPRRRAKNSSSGRSLPCLCPGPPVCAAFSTGSENGRKRLCSAGGNQYAAIAQGVGFGVGGFEPPEPQFLLVEPEPRRINGGGPVLLGSATRQQ